MDKQDIEAIKEMLAGIYIQQLRIYDLLAITASGVDQEKVEKLALMHEAGEVLSPEPALKMEE